MMYVHYYVVEVKYMEVKYKYQEVKIVILALGLQNPLDMMYHMQPWMILALMPLSVGFEGTHAPTHSRARTLTHTRACTWESWLCSY